jgi:hypothetical protein
MFEVDDIDDTAARRRAHRAELLGEVAQCQSIFRHCYLCGPRASSSPGRTDQLTRARRKERGGDVRALEDEWSSLL